MARKRGAPNTAIENKSPTQRRKLNPKTKSTENETPKKVIENKSPAQVRKSSARLKRKAERETLKTPIEKKSAQKRKKTPKSKRNADSETPKAPSEKSPAQRRKSTPKKKQESAKEDVKVESEEFVEEKTKETPKENLKKKKEANAKVSPKVKREGDYEPRLDTKTVKSAVEALKKDGLKATKKRGAKGAKKAKDVEEERDDMFVHLVITLKQAPFKAKLRPYSIPLKHSLYNAGEAEVCFFVKDPQRLMKDHLDANGHGGVTRVMGVDKLRKRYSTYEGRNELADEYDLFLVDNRVAPMMPTLLGKVFMNKKKMPLAVDVRRDVVSSIQKMMSGTSLLLRQGSCLNVRIGRMGFEVDELVENVEIAMQAVVKKIDGGWLGVQAVSVKSDKSPALPIYRQELTAAEQ